MNNIFITGGTGFLGSLLINEVLASSNDMVHVLVRDKFAAFGKNRIISAIEKLNDGTKLDEKKRNRIQAYTGDITRKNLGLNRGAIQELTITLDSIIHSAAVTDLNLPLKQARLVNVTGTQNVLDFALLCKEKGSLRKLNHVSTAYIAGDQKCIFKESDFHMGQVFNNTYEQSKYEAEKLVRVYRDKGLDIDIFRPAIMLGRYRDGMTTSFKMFYQPLHFFSREIFDKIPAREHSKANMINIDIAAKAILLISKQPKSKNMTYHIVSPKMPNLDYLLNIGSEYFGFIKPELVKFEEINVHKEYSFIKEKLISPYIPYMNYLTEFDMKNTKAALRGQNFRFPELNKRNLIRLFEYCDKTGFIKRKKHASKG